MERIWAEKWHSRHGFQAIVGREGQIVLLEDGRLERSPSFGAKDAPKSMVAIVEERITKA